MSECNFKKASDAIDKCIQELLSVDFDLSKLIVGADAPCKARDIAKFANKCTIVSGNVNRQDDSKDDINKVATALKNAIAMRDNLNKQLEDIEKDIKQLHAKLENEVEKEAGVKCEITLPCLKSEQDVPPEEWKVGDILVFKYPFYDLSKDRKYIVCCVNGDLVKLEDCVKQFMTTEVHKDHFKFHSRPV